MGKGSSSSSSSAQTTSVNEDNRVVAENGGVALAKGASFTINEALPDSVVNVFSDLINLTKEVTVQAGQAISAESTKAIDAVSNSYSDSMSKVTQGSASLISDIAPYIAMTVVGLVAFMYLSKGKRK